MSIDLSKWNMRRLSKAAKAIDEVLLRERLPFPDSRKHLTEMLVEVNAELLKRVQAACNADAAKRGFE